MSTSPSLLKAELILVSVTIIAAFGWIFSKEALAELPPIFFLGVRFVIAGIVLFFVGARFFKGIRWQDLKGATLVGAVMSIAMMFWIVGLDQVSNIGVGAFINSLGVILVPVFARFMFKERPARSIWVALPIAVIGLGCLALGNGVSFEWAQGFFLVSAITFAFQFNLLTRMSTKLHVLVLTAIQLFTAGVVMLMVSPTIEEVPHSVSLPIVGWFLASTLIATSLRFLLQTYGQSLTPASHAAVIMNLEPVWTALLAAIWFSETMTSLQLIGCALIFSAMLVSKWSQVRAFLRRKTA
ncbi:MAG: EamA/RhaT family transporter [Marinomonas sp.]|uniref:EamA domain-containing membrane protein RarD n=1 Tax=Marinomonas communis TaxID=28254 RepID=A0A4R6X199_9GAMM|nr:EamA family transporter [Marinomonas communis]RUM55673.1 MAG: EamA/RhaT family transporter [Marinomonas sp.]RUM56318.1 MAG: EamA/RhaT family transporter [Marinomonas sp.]TDR12635.1 EamA domain-containing membrane protein RarD [Marinomonas communis]